jgi:uncharacterized protein
MNSFFSRLDRLRVLALLLWALPMVILLPLGMLWLWQMRALPYWLAAMVAASAAGYGLQRWLQRRERQLLNAAKTQPDPGWPPKADAPWQAVEALAEQARPDDWPLNDGGRLWTLGRDTLRLVARHYHPTVDQPLLELTVPHTLLIIERASRDLRITLTRQIPFSHRLILGDLNRAWRWKATAERLLNVYRAGRLVINPADALLGEIWGRLRAESFGTAWSELQRWLLREYIRKVGYYAIALYSGQLTLTEREPTEEPLAKSRRDLEQAGGSLGEPLRIVVLGRANAGKSSLINALFGTLTAATDGLPDTTATLTPYRLERDGLDAALIFDTPGYDTERLTDPVLEKIVRDADLLLWVCAAHRADRGLDREKLDAVRAWQIARPNRRPPPLLVAVSHIDQLRPPREWRPPYDLVNPQNRKAIHIGAAVAAVATDLALPVAAVIPVCLDAGRLYNVEDALWLAILDQQTEAGRARFLRCLEARKRTENWALLGQQLSNAGRWLLDLPNRPSH